MLEIITTVELSLKYILFFWTLFIIESCLKKVSHLPQKY